MKRFLSLLIFIIFMFATLTFNASATDIKSFNVVANGGEDMATIAWDSVAGADFYKLSITEEYSEYSVSETTALTYFEWQPYEFSMDTTTLIKVYAYNSDGVMIAESIDLYVSVMIMQFDYWSVYGDTDLDLAVTVIDATKVLHHEAKLIQLSKASLSAADVNNDGVTSIIDATIIQRFCAALTDGYSGFERLGNSFWYGGTYYEIINETEEF